MAQVDHPRGRGHRPDRVQDRAGEWWIATGQGLYRFARVARVDHLAGARPKAVYTTRDGLAGDIREIRPPEHLDHDLTPHELRLLNVLAEGHNYQSAAAELGVSFSTINFHMQDIYGKLQVYSKSEAVAKALRHRLVRNAGGLAAGTPHQSRARVQALRYLVRSGFRACYRWPVRTARWKAEVWATTRLLKTPSEWSPRSF